MSFYSVWLCGLYYDASCLVLLCFCPRVSSILLALCSHRLGKRELVCVRLVQLFLYFASINFCPFSPPLGVRGWLWLLTVALPGLFY